MFARSKHHAADMVRQYEILERIAALVDPGNTARTATTRLHGITADTLRTAHRLLGSGHTVGKVVIGR